MRVAGSWVGLADVTSPHSLGPLSTARGSRGTASTRRCARENDATWPQHANEASCEWPPALVPTEVTCEIGKSDHEREHA